MHADKATEVYWMGIRRSERNVHYTDLHLIMMTSSNGNFFHVTGSLCRKNSPVTAEFPSQSQWRGALMFSLICAWINGWLSNREADDLRRHRVHYDVTVMLLLVLCSASREFIYPILWISLHIPWVIELYGNRALPLLVASLMSPVASLVTTDRCSYVSMCLSISTKYYLFPGIVPLLYSVGNKTYYYYCTHSNLST